MKQKIDIDWKKAVVFLVVTGGIYYIARALIHLEHPFLMTLGILLLLFIGDYFAQVLDSRFKHRKGGRADDEDKKTE